MFQQNQLPSIDLSKHLLRYTPICNINNQSSFYTGINNSLISPFVIHSDNEQKHTRFTAPLAIGKDHNLLDLMTLHSNDRASKLVSRIDNDIAISKCYVEHPSGVIKIFTPVEDSGVLVNTTSNTYGIISVLEGKYTIHHEQDGVIGKAVYTKRFSLDINLNMTTSGFKSSIYSKPYLHDAEFIYNKHSYLLKRDKKQVKRTNQLLAQFKLRGIELEAFVY